MEKRVQREWYGSQLTYSLTLMDLVISFDFFFYFFLRVIKTLLLHQGICFIANEITPTIIKLYATLRRVSPKSKQCYCALLIYKRRQPNVDADGMTMGQAVK